MNRKKFADIVLSDSVRAASVSEQIPEAFSCFLLLLSASRLRSEAAACRRIVSRSEEFTEVRPLLVPDRFGNMLPAVILSARTVECAVPAYFHVPPALLT